MHCPLCSVRHSEFVQLCFPALLPPLDVSAMQAQQASETGEQPNKKSNNRKPVAVAAIDALPQRRFTPSLQGASGSCWFAAAGGSTCVFSQKPLAALLMRRRQNQRRPKEILVLLLSCVAE